MKLRQDSINPNLAEVLAGRERVDSEEKLKQLRERDRADTVSVQNAVIKLLTRGEFPVLNFYVQNVKFI